jgi:hypothetical protein
MIHAPHPSLRIVHSNPMPNSSASCSPPFRISTSCRMCSSALLPNTLLIDLEAIARHDHDALRNIMNAVAHARALIAESAAHNDDQWPVEDNGTGLR